VMLATLKRMTVTKLGTMMKRMTAVRLAIESCWVCEGLARHGGRRSY
jgi:hypothetical protein